MAILRSIEGWVLGAFVALAAQSLPAATTVYVGPHFEVRDHDAPVKYVFHGNTRVARVTGSLAPQNERLQRWRLRPGWNLVSLAVTAPDLPGQLAALTGGPAPELPAIRRWQPATQSFVPLPPGETAPAGTVLWVSARSHTLVAIRGAYTEPAQWRAPADGAFVAVPALEAQPWTVPPGATVWRYEAPTGRWQADAASDLAPGIDPNAFPAIAVLAAGAFPPLPPVLAPGEAIYVHAGAPVDLPLAPPQDRVRYYHQDHLGSASAVTDAAGAVAVETAFYPFGLPRHAHRPRPVEEPYGFTQKERDPESGLHYFEARYLAGGLGRFATVDPKYARPDALDPADLGRFLGHPQELNLCAYARNNPLNLIDPTGLEVTVKTTEDRPGHRATEIHITGVVLNESGRNLTRAQMVSVIGRIASQVRSDFSGSGDRQSWSTSLNLRVATSRAEVHPTDHLFRIVDQVDPSDVAPVVTLGEVNAIGGKDIRLRASLVDQRLRPDGAKPSLERVASHELGHALGLRHREDVNNPIRNKLGGQNLMRAVEQIPRGTQINVHQIREIQRLHTDGQLNR